MANIACSIRAAGAGSTQRAEDARQSPRVISVGDGSTQRVGYNADVLVPYYLPVSGTPTLFVDTIKARSWALLWQGDMPSTLAANHQLIDRTAGTYVLFSAPTSGGLGQLMAVEQAQWPTINGTLDLLGQQMVYADTISRYQPRQPVGCPFWVTSPTDPIVHWIAGSGASGWSGDGGDPRAAKLRNPWAVTKGPDGAYYVGCDGSVRRVTCHQISTVAGTGTGGHTGDGPATSTPVRQITGVVFDSTGLMWVTDFDNTAHSAIPGATVFGYTALRGATNGSSFTLLNALDPLHPPYGAYYLPNGPFHMQQYNTLRGVDLSANTLTTPPLTRKGPGYSPGDKAGGEWALSQGTGLAIGPDDTLYVSLYTDIDEAFPDTDAFTGALFSNMFNVQFNGLFTVNPNRTAVGTLLWVGYSQQPPTITTQFPLVFTGTTGYPIQLPGSPWVTADGSVYWPNGNFNANRLLNGDPSVQKRSPAGVFSQIGTDYNFEGTAVAVDGAGNVYASDTRRHRILRWDAITGAIKVICGVTDSGGNTPPGSPGPATHIDAPQGIHVTPEGIVTFTSNGKVLQIGGNS